MSPHRKCAQGSSTPSALPPPPPMSMQTTTALAPTLIERWSRLLPLQRGESLLLALDLWARVRPRLSVRELTACGAADPFAAALAGCLWIAAKMEECRRGLPNATKIGALVGAHRGVMNSIELYLMGLVDWRPTAGWQERRGMYAA